MGVSLAIENGSLTLRGIRNQLRGGGVGSIVAIFVIARMVICTHDKKFFKGQKYKFNC
ncbi:hypothetical protein HMPREF1551_02054 [Capnocytophaga sp. oral taxon 863 str. F0517]|nr:hypothetical protein HMPREF1551_02054 [Capnocytophaga sp. oral taxon 863 str. F0517]